MPQDWDNLLSFYTFKYVRIRHKKLGAMRWGAVVLTYIYIILYAAFSISHSGPGHGHDHDRGMNMTGGGGGGGATIMMTTGTNSSGRLDTRNGTE